MLTKEILSLNLYAVIGLENTSDDKAIKRAYNKLMLVHHPDKGGDVSVFEEIKTAYDVLSDTDLREEYDKKSKFGNQWNEKNTILDLDRPNVDVVKIRNGMAQWKSDNLLNIVVKMPVSEFTGKITYDRYAVCKKCSGSGTDLNAKVHIRDEKGKIVRTFESAYGCDCCEGTGKMFDGNLCWMCKGQGKISMVPCKKCNGAMRTLGKQTVRGIKRKPGETKIVLEGFGHVDKNGSGRNGDVIIVLVE